MQAARVGSGMGFFMYYTYPECANGAFAGRNGNAYLFVLTLQTRGTNSFYQVFLEENEDQHRWKDGKACHCEHCAVVGRRTWVAEQL